MSLWTVLIAIVVFLLSSQNLPLELILLVLPLGPHTDLTYQLTHQMLSAHLPVPASMLSGLEPQGLTIWWLAFGV